jgi:hypothetical protein
MIDEMDVDFRAALPAVRDQGARPTCLAHAVSAAHEHARGTAVPLSPEYLHFFATGGTPSGGCSVEDISRALITQGQPEETECPYLGGEPSVGWHPPTGLTVFRRVSEERNCDGAVIEQMVRNHQSPVLGISLPKSFYSPTAPWILASSGSIMGLHAVVGVGVGRHQGQRTILIRNSWGSGWGDGGHAWLDESFVTTHLKGVLLLTHEAGS